MPDTKQEIASTYEQYIGMFVTAERKNGLKAVGILKEITGDNKLHIKGKYTFWLVDPEEIVDFTARPDRFQNNGGGHNR